MLPESGIISRNYVEFIVKLGDKVQLVKGNPLGKIGTITGISLITGPANLENNPRCIGKVEHNFFVTADDGSKFHGFQDQLKIIKRI
jgi:hypothetical protein